MNNSIIAYNPCSKCEKDKCNICEFDMYRQGILKKDKWISVEEKLPINDYEKHWKNRNHYLVFTQPCEIMFVATYGYKNNDWWCDMNNFVLDEKNWSTVTHWMPLPTPPKMKGAENE
jgi:hypothetical protein